jgi:hypothetical protein
MTRKEADSFIRKHSIETRRPITKDGKPNPHRLEVDYRTFCDAASKELRYANDPKVVRRLQNDLDKSKMDKKLQEAVKAFLPG